MIKENTMFYSRNYLIILLVFTNFYSNAQKKNKVIEEVVIDTVYVEETKAKPDKEKDYEIPFIVVEQTPCPIECDKFNVKSDRITCTKAFIKNNVLNKINTDLINELGVFTKDEKISFLFKFDVNGKIIDVKCSAPHPELEKEGIRVIKLLPEFIPGKQRRYNVIVPYWFSIKISEIMSNVNDED